MIAYHVSHYSKIVLSRKQQDLFHMEEVLPPNVVFKSEGAYYLFSSLESQQALGKANRDSKNVTS